MAEAGYPDGFDVELATRSSAGGSYADLIALVAEQLKKHLNINATLKLYDSAAGYAQYDVGNFQFFAQGSSFNLADPDGVMRRYHEKTTFAGGPAEDRLGKGGCPRAFRSCTWSRPRTGPGQTQGVDSQDQRHLRQRGQRPCRSVLDRAGHARREPHPGIQHGTYHLWRPETRAHLV